MKVIVVYESHWGNTAAVATGDRRRLGPDAQALTTDEAAPTAVADADLIVAGAPVMAFRPAERQDARDDGQRHEGADAAGPVAPVDACVAGAPAGRPRTAAQFETGLRWSPGGATGAIADKLRRLGSSDSPRVAASSSRARTARFARASSSVRSSGGRNSPRR